MADWPDPAQPGFIAFYSDSRNNNVKLPEDRALRSLPQIEQTMREVLTVPDNFFGIVDRGNAILQFAVNDDSTIRIDLPDPSRKGSLVKDADLEECITLVRQAGPSLAALNIVGMEFESWE
jgi:hypothetical protein